MSYQLLPGRTLQRVQQNSSTPVLLAVIVLGALVALVAWQMQNRRSPELAQNQSLVPVQTPTPPAAAVLPTPVSDDFYVHASSVRKELLAASEQVVHARRLLEQTAPDLDRNFLQNSSRRVQSATAACVVTQEAIERALEELRIATHQR
jgi:hypothetical protein